MTPEAAFTALVEADPIPDASAYARNRVTGAVFLSGTLERRSDMQTVQRTDRTVEKRRFSLGQAVAFAAVLVIVAVGIALVVSRGSGDVADLPAPPFETPQEAVEAYLAILESGDAEAHAAAMAENAVDYVLDGLGADRAQVAARVVARGAEGYRTELGSCRELTSMATVCALTIVGGIDHSLSGEHTTEIIMSLDQTGRIGRVTGITQADDYPQWNEWISTNHPDLVDELMQLWGPTFDPTARAPEDIIADEMAALDEYLAQRDQ